MYTTHPLMVIDACAKYGKSMSNKKTVMGRTWKHVKISLNSTEVKHQRRIRIMGVSHTLYHGDTSMCRFWQANVKLKKKVMDRTQKHFKNPLNLTLRSKVNVISGSRMCAKHNLMIMGQTSSYDNIPMCQIW